MRGNHISAENRPGTLVLAGSGMLAGSGRLSVALALLGMWAAATAGPAAAREVNIQLENGSPLLMTDFRALPAGLGDVARLRNRIVDPSFVLGGGQEKFRLNADDGCRYHIVGRVRQTDQVIAILNQDVCKDPVVRFVPVAGPAGAATSPRTSVEIASSGTGFIVSRDGDVLTNYHVIAQCQIVSVRFGHVSRLATPIATDPGSDLALIRVSDKAEVLRNWAGEGQRLTSPFRRIASFSSRDKVTLGERVTVFGFPLRGTLDVNGVLVEGVVNALDGAKPREIWASSGSSGVPAPDRFQMSAPIQRGNSGSPVLDAQGNIVGVVAAALQTDLGAMSFAIKHDVAVKFLTTNKVDIVRGRESETRPLTELAAAAQDMTGAVECWR